MKMPRYLLSVLIMFIFMANIHAQNLKPYIMGASSGKAMDQVISELKANLEGEGLSVLGEFSPANDPDRWVMVVSSSGLVDAVKQVGGMTGLAAALRVGLTTVEDKVMISYTNPAYWGNAYYRSDYPDVEQHFVAITASLDAAAKNTGEFIGETFGSEKGVEVDDLRKYRYMFGMPRFDDPVELNTFPSFEDATTKIDGNISAGVKDVSLVYAIEIPYERLKLYGFALGGEKGETAFLPKIDISDPKHTAFLPYEILVMDGRVIMLHGRYRIALSFPDLSMGTFTKIMSTPGDIKDMLITVTE